MTYSLGQSMTTSWDQWSATRKAQLLEQTAFEWKPEHLAITVGAVALIGTIMAVRIYKKKRTRKRR